MILFVRSILGAALAVMLMRIFHPNAHIIYTILLGVFLIGIAYFSNYKKSISKKKTSLKNGE